jgi:hypothetical protein
MANFSAFISSDFFRPLKACQHQSELNPSIFLHKFTGSPSASLSLLLYHPFLPPPSPSVTLPPYCSSRGLAAPNGLQEAIALGQSVQAVVALGATAHEAAERIHLVLARVAARLVDFADADLDRRVVFGFDYRDDLGFETWVWARPLCHQPLCPCQRKGRVL